MSTASKTSKSSAAFETKKRSYVPGEAVAATSQGDGKRARTTSKPQRLPAPFPDIPADVLDKILQSMLQTPDAGLSVIKLSMVSRVFREGVNQNLPVWYQLYIQWRGPVRSETTNIRTSRGLVSLRPTIPVSVPNFRIKTPPLT